MTSRRVVLVFPEPPLPFGGASARWYHVLTRVLRDSGVKFVALACCPPKIMVATRAELSDLATEVHLFPHDLRTGLRSRVRSALRPFSYVYGPELRAALREEAERAEVLHVEGTWGVSVVEPWLSRALIGVQNLFAIDLASLPAGGVVPRARQYSALLAERRFIRRAEHLAPLTPRLADHLRAWNPSANIQTVPLAIDTSLYRFQPAPTSGPLLLGLIGNFGWPPTLQAATRLVTRLWPKIMHQVPRARLQLIGRNADTLPAALRLASGVEVHSDVPDTRPFFHALKVLLYAPPEGSGMKIKIMEAMALGTAVVTNDQGSEGLPVASDVELSIRADDDDLVAAAVQLLTDDTRRLAQAEAARVSLDRLCDFERVADRVTRAYDQVKAFARAVK